MTEKTRMYQLTMTVELPNYPSPDYDWIHDKAMDFMHDHLGVQPYNNDGSNQTDADGVPIEDTVQSLVMALVWRLRSNATDGNSG